MTLSRFPLVAFVSTTDLARAEAFYHGVLGLDLIERTDFALVLDAFGTTLRVTAAPVVDAAGYTVLGWTVDDITVTVRELAAQGLTMSRFPGLDQDREGVWQSPSGAKIAWFADPDGNILSVTEVARSGRP